MASDQSTGAPTDAMVAAGAVGTMIALTKRLTTDVAALIAGSGATLKVEGEVAHNVAHTGVNPVLIGASDGTNVRRLLVDTSADNLRVTLFESGTRLNSALPNADNVAPGTYQGLVVTNFPYAWDGANWQRLRGDTTGALRAGTFTTVIKTAAVVQAAAYSIDDLVGGKLTFSSAARYSGGSGRIKGIVLGDQAANAATVKYDLYIFDADPTGTTFTENAPLDIADADLNKILAVVPMDGTGGVGSYILNVDNAVRVSRLDVPFQCSGTANLFGALVIRGAAPTYAATTDVFVTLVIEQN